MNKLIILTFWIFFLFVKSSYSHDPKNCDVLENYDFSQFDNWKTQVIENAPQYDLDKNFVKTLVQDYQINKRVIENDIDFELISKNATEGVPELVSDLLDD